ncbi:conserved hypothetical protein [Helicobacter cinaedi CCUG 18818 = ATCC BAA-847]|uniref:PD-(D/E)XK endonuclease-like domain-containing protein n=1 Tax=Helicobacter cinaedi CCUG 18818 = ATCC BAA-847 TaxID=537971 RepID=A0AAI8MMQ5_9HELI|nr:conserved hypothetical protein [Helicobacter cinaedi CCUG 18818 = ATCC BAA-847]
MQRECKVENTLKVYSSNRALMQNLSPNELLSPYMMIGEFFSQLIIVEGYRALPKAMRLPLGMAILKECARELVGAKLIFEESFLGFLETSNFLFAFFDELAQARVSVKQIPSVDIYGDYADHLALLEKIESRYKQRLEELKFYDGFILPSGAKITLNEAFIKHFSGIELFIEGVINPRHQEILSQVADSVPIKVHFWLDDYNKALNFLPLDILRHCQTYHRYVVDYKSGEILESAPLKICEKIDTYSFGLGISQVALVFAKIGEWIKAGVSEEDIVIIVPNESFSKYLSLLDKGHNFNFAMGKDIRLSAAYKRLEELLQECAENALDMGLDSESSLKSMGAKSYVQICEMIQNAIAPCDDRQSKKVREYVGELLFIWGGLNLSACELGDILSFLLEELAQKSIDDIHGGKITVMGVLESRGFAYKKAVIVDCNKDVIPNVSENDLFLNSRLRSALKMPTLRDKEQLQKHYYYGVFSTANEVAVAFVENEDKQASPLLDELAQKTKVSYYNGDLLFSLLPQGRKLAYCEDKFFGKMPEVLTPSRLKVFLDCPRKYYYIYIEQMSGAGSDNASLGNALHQCLESVYQPYVGKNLRLDMSEIVSNTESWLDDFSLKAESALSRAEIELLKCELRKFFTQANLSEKQSEIEILQLEGQNMNLELKGFSFYMRPDRIQRVGEIVEIIDYKYRRNFDTKHDMANDFAMNLYDFAFKQSNSVYKNLPICLYYWDIRGGVQKSELQEKGEKLLEKLTELQGEIEFSKAESRKPCRYCEFVDLCDR